MKIRILGFEPVIEYLPPAVAPTSCFEWLRSHSGQPLTKTITAAVTVIDEWFVGVVLKSRDSLSITKILSEGNVRILKAEKLPEGHSLAEANFFVAHSETGRELYAYHHMSASMTNDFAWVCAKAFNTARQAALDEKLKPEGLAAKVKAMLQKEHRGKFTLSQLLNKTSLADFLKNMKRVQSFEATFTAFDLTEDIFDPISKQARRKSVKFDFSPDTLLASIEPELEKAAASQELEDFWVQGVTRQNKTLEFHKKKNALVFEEYDYDEMLGGLDIRFDDWHLSISRAEITKKLLGIAKGQRVGKLLSEPL